MGRWSVRLGCSCGNWTGFRGGGSIEIVVNFVYLIGIVEVEVSID